MFLKLLKNDFLNSWKDFALSYIAGIAMAAFFILIVKLPDDLNYFIILLLVLGVIAMSITMFVLSLRAVIRLLYSRLYTIDPVTTWTQPVSSSLVLLSKLLVGFIFECLSFIIMGLIGYLTLMIILGGYDVSLNEMINEISAYITIDFGTFIVLGVSFIASYCLQACIILFAGALTNSSWIRSHRKILSIVFYCITYSVVSIIISVFNTLLNMNSPILYSELQNSIIFSLTNSLPLGILYFGINFFIAAVLFGLSKLFIDKKLEVM